MNNLFLALLNPLKMVALMQFNAFDRDHFAPLGNQSNRGNAPAHWTYRTADTHATIDTVGYFDNGTTTNTGMRNVLAIGDIVHVTVVDDEDTPTSVSTYGTHVINANSSGIIDASDVSVGTVTDSD